MFRPLEIRHYLDYMQSQGFAQADVLAGTGIDADRLKESGYLVDSLQSSAVIHNMLRLTANPGLGFEIGRQAELVDLGIVGHAMLSSKNGRASAGIWVRYSNALVGMLLKTSLQENPGNGHWTMKFSAVTSSNLIYRFCVEESLMLILKLGGQLVDQEPTAVRVQLAYPAPDYVDQYARYLGCQPEFDARSTQVTFSSPSLNQPFRGNDAEFNAICVQHCSQIARQVVGKGPLILRLREMLIAQRAAYPSLGEAAARLHVSPRTLRRRLQEEGFTYKRLVNEVRFDLACEYLRSGHITPKEVAYLVGFQTADAFRAAFKSWTGMTVGAYQETKRSV